MFSSTVTTHEISHFTTTITPIIYTPITNIVSSRNIGNNSTPVEEIVNDFLVNYYCSNTNREINIDNYYNEDIDELPNHRTEDINLD